jgi:hypothetical protein
MEPGRGGREDELGGPLRSRPWDPAAMEPGRGGREDSYVFAVDVVPRWPQWSPAGEAGKTVQPGDIPACVGLPQWSPAGEAGKTARRNHTL